MKQSEAIDKLAQALCKSQSKIKGAVKDAQNPFFKSSYADLESVWEAIREPLTTEGLAVAQTTSYHEDAGTCVVTTLMHSSGQWIQGLLPCNMVKRDPQAQGSAISYARRYALAAMCGVVQVDDDAEKATDRSKKAPPQVKRDSLGPVVKSPQVAPQAQKQSAEGGPGDYVIEFGKFKGQRIAQIPVPDLKSYINYVTSSDEISENGRKLVTFGEAYLAGLFKK